MSHTAIIFEAAGADPAADRFTFTAGGSTTTVVLTGDADGVPALAAELVAAGAGAVELCGGFGPVPQARAQAAVGDRAPARAVLFGFESLEAVAAYKTGFATGERLPGGFLLLHPGADPATDRRTWADEVAPATFVAVPDVAAAATVARELAASGTRLFELYGGLGAEGAAAVLDATGGGTIPVGLAA